MKERRREILRAVESFKFKSGIDAHAVKTAANGVADAIEFYLDAVPQRVEPLVVTEKNGRSSEDQKMEHRILFKVRFKRKANWEPGLRKSALIFPSSKDAFSSVIASVSGVDLRVCDLIAAEEHPEAVEEKRTATILDIRRLIKGYSESHHGQQTVGDLMKWAREKAHKDITDDLQRVMATAVANGFTEEQVITVMRNAVVKDVMRK